MGGNYPMSQTHFVQSFWSICLKIAGKVQIVKETKNGFALGHKLPNLFGVLSIKKLIDVSSVICL